jgi:hypothetical protein
MMYQQQPNTIQVQIQGKITKGKTTKSKTAQGDPRPSFGDLVAVAFFGAHLVIQVRSRLASAVWLV